MLIPLVILGFGKTRIATVDEVEPRVVVIFGAGLRANGQPSDALSDRLQVGAELFGAGKATQILVSGDNRFEDYNEPQVMHDVLVRDYNIPEERISIDFAGRRTYDTCIRAKTLWNVDQAILVTQQFHLPRAIWTCERLDIESMGVSASLQTYQREEYFTFRELLAMYKAFIDIYLVKPDYVSGKFEEDLSQ